MITKPNAPQRLLTTVLSAAMAFTGPTGLDLSLDLLGMPSMDAPDEFVSVRRWQDQSLNLGARQVTES